MNNQWHGGKGDAPRSGFDHQKYRENFDKIFKKPPQDTDKPKKK